MSDKIFADGLIFKRPRESAPTFVKGSMSFKVDEFKKFLDLHNNAGWVNLDLKESQGGKLYCELNAWKPEDKTREQKLKEVTEEAYNHVSDPNDIPF